MKKLIYFILGIWSAVAGFLSPVWLTFTVLNLTGMIYQYDYTMDEGTAGILGFMMLSVWLLVAQLPCSLFLRKMRVFSRRAFTGSVLALAVLVLLGIVIEILRFPQFL